MPVEEWSQERVDAEFFALVTDLAGAPREIIDPVSGVVVGFSRQSLYGRRSWLGDVSSPLLFAGQYVDAESGWAYNRFRYYDPYAGVYNAQDPLGLAPRIASAQGYVDHAAYWVDFLGLMSHEVSKLVWNEARGIFEGASEATKLNARELRANMLKEGMVPLPGDEAHHIIPARLNRGAAEQIRMTFEEHGLGLNDAANGEFLPKNVASREAGDLRLGHHGSDIHSAAEMNAIYGLIRTAGSREEIVSKLAYIRGLHQNDILLSSLGNGASL